MLSNQHTYAAQMAWLQGRGAEGELESVALFFIKYMCPIHFIHLPRYCAVDVSDKGKWIPKWKVDSPLRGLWG